MKVRLNILYILIALLFLVSSCAKKMTVGFYDITQNQKNALEENIIPLVTDKKGRVQADFIILDENRPLQSQIKKNIDLVFAPNGRQVKNLSRISQKLSNETIQAMPSSMRQLAVDNNSVYALPIFLDHIEVAYSYDILNGELPPKTMTELISLAKSSLNSKNSGFYPIFCVGNETTEFFLFISTLTESYFGENAYLNLLETIKKEHDFDTILLTPLTKDNKTLNDVISILNDWKKKGLIHPSWQHASFSDLENFLEISYAPIIFISLNTHRKLPVRLIQNYVSSWVPIGSKRQNRSLIVPATMGIALSKKTLSNKINPAEILKYLVSEKEQGELSVKTGFAPVHANSEVRDSQAGDVRLWAASSNQILYSIEYAFLDPQKAEEFADFLRQKL